MLVSQLDLAVWTQSLNELAGGWENQRQRELHPCRGHTEAKNFVRLPSTDVRFRAGVQSQVGDSKVIKTSK